MHDFFIDCGADVGNDNEDQYSLKITFHALNTVKLYNSEGNRFSEGNSCKNNIAMQETRMLKHL